MQVARHTALAIASSVSVRPGSPPGERYAPTHAAMTLAAQHSRIDSERSRKSALSRPRRASLAWTSLRSVAWLSVQASIASRENTDRRRGAAKSMTALTFGPNSAPQESANVPAPGDVRHSGGRPAIGSFGRLPRRDRNKGELGHVPEKVGMCGAMASRSPAPYQVREPADLTAITGSVNAMPLPGCFIGPACDSVRHDVVRRISFQPARPDHVWFGGGEVTNCRARSATSPWLTQFYPISPVLTGPGGVCWTNSH
jgi:hypothetical protein